MVASGSECCVVVESSPSIVAARVSPSPFGAVLTAYAPSDLHDAVSVLPWWSALRVVFAALMSAAVTRGIPSSPP